MPNKNVPVAMGVVWDKYWAKAVALRNSIKKKDIK